MTSRTITSRQSPAAISLLLGAAIAITAGFGARGIPSGVELETDEERAAREEADAKMREAQEHVEQINRARRFARQQHNAALVRAQRQKQTFMAAHKDVKGKAAKKAAKKAAQQMRDSLNLARLNADVKIENEVGTAEPVSA